MDKFDDHELYLSFYGDDFTGSTDVLESLTLQGLPAALFLKPPTLAEVQNFSLKNKQFGQNTRLKAFGVAGVSRSMTPAQMTTELPDIFEKISRIPARFFHYKVCSTFDSSPEVGNIGCAVEIALRHFPSAFIPLLIASPNLNRFCAFGNLFARVDDTTYRLDRHPTMSRHPVTPMRESDLRLHLGKQTERNIRLLDVLTLEGEADKMESLLTHIKNSPEPEYLLIDIINQAHIRKAGNILIRHSQENLQLLVGSSGIENAITTWLQENKIIAKPAVNADAGRSGKMVAMAGSCSPRTQSQIEWAVKIGFAPIRIRSERLADPQTCAAEMDHVVNRAVALLPERNAVLYTALGPEDESIGSTKQKLSEKRPENAGDPISHLPRMQGKMLKRILTECPDTRVAVAGGDTSGYVAAALEISALEILTPIAPGAPLCIAHSNNPLFDGLQIALKGGQNGNERYFESIQSGRLLNE